MSKTTTNITIGISLCVVSGLIGDFNSFHNLLAVSFAIIGGMFIFNGFIGIRWMK